MNPSPSSLSRRGFLTTTATLSATVGIGNAQRTTRRTTTMGTSTSSEGAPKPAWTFPESMESSSDESPRLAYPIAVEDGVLATITVKRTDGGPPQYALHGLGVEDGHEKWSHEFTVITLPVVEDGTMFISARSDEHSDGEARQLVAIDVATGEIRWRKPAGSYSARLQADDERVYLVSNEGNSVLALDTETGERAWGYNIGGDDVSNLILSDGTLYVSQRDILYALSAADGTKRWEKSWGQTSIYVETVTEKNVFCRVEGDLWALDPADGSERWSVTDGNAMVTDDGRVYVWRETLRAVDAEDGAIIWQYDDVTPVSVDPVVADGAVFGANRQGSIYSIATDGTERWTFETDVPDNYYSIILEVRDGLVYAMLGKTLYVLSAEDGSLEWSFTGPGRAVSTIVTHDDVFFGTRGGLYAFDRHHSLVSTVVDGTSDFFSSVPGMALSAGVLGTAAFAAYRRFNDDEEAATADAAESDTEPEYGRLDRIAADEFTETYRVRKRSDEGPKIVAARRLTDPDVAEPFRSATERWAEMSDRPGVVPVLETDGESFELPYYGDGSLADPSRSVEERLDALSDANAVVHDAHGDGLIHGGLTPESVLLDGDDVAVADWELAAALAEYRDQSPYAAPEQVADGETDERTDVYRLGAIAAFVLTGKTPADEALDMLNPEYRAAVVAGADSDEYESLRSDAVSSELYDVVSTAMAEDPDDRYGSVVEFDDMLRWAAFRA
ncbi:PQQ-binding-like beta-propeller repeat protein [Haladaptatus sp. DYF46]|uniref:outer membrane protein assembly factor BamB family protein n=1 Tax=Haladaptatus sp. DYF46 TaxID=2886041 RepID=UPI001E58A371|nr:PQQ-binding-like beta-propeller repeat protein [Haladaptatus sp. DYF46]